MLWYHRHSRLLVIVRTNGLQMQSTEGGVVVKYPKSKNYIKWIKVTEKCGKLYYDSLLRPGHLVE